MDAHAHLIWWCAGAYLTNGAAGMRDLDNYRYFDHSLTNFCLRTSCAAARRITCSTDGAAASFSRLLAVRCVGCVRERFVSAAIKPPTVKTMRMTASRLMVFI